MFETLQQAEKFAGGVLTLTYTSLKIPIPVTIIKVRCLIPAMKPGFVADLIYMHEFYEEYPNTYSTYARHTVAEPLEGTVCCKYIEILP